MSSDFSISDVLPTQQEANPNSSRSRGINIDLNEDPGDTTGDTFLFDLNEDPQDDTTDNAQTEHIPQATNHHETRRNRLSSVSRLNILLWLLERTNNGKLVHGAINSTAEEFNVSRRIVGKIWSIARQQRDTGQRYNLTPKYSNCGRKCIEVPRNEIAALNMGDRSCIRDLACKINVSKSTAHRWVKRGAIRPHTNPLHPGLKEPNKFARMEWIMSLIHGSTPEAKTDFHPMYNFVHLDEKWFYLSKKSHRVYLEQNEKGKYRSASSSKFIPKVMFTAVVARPKFDEDGQCIFDGKIGIFPFTFKEAAKRGSKNRQKGTIVTKLVESVNQKVTRNMLINQIIPAIMAKWPQDGRHQVIYIQQDNAKAHIKANVPEWMQVYQQPGFTFVLTQQPPNSPDLNILDLGFFRSIQSLMHKKMPKNVDDMLDAVHEAFYELDPKTLDNVWYTLQHVMIAILKDKGGNDFDLPHIHKARLQAQGVLPAIVQAPTTVVMQAWDLLHGGEVQEAGPSHAYEDNGNETQGIDGEDNEDVEDNHEFM